MTESELGIDEDTNSEPETEPESDPVLLIDIDRFETESDLKSGPEAGLELIPELKIDEMDTAESEPESKPQSKTELETDKLFNIEPVSEPESKTISLDNKRPFEFPPSL